MGETKNGRVQGRAIDALGASAALSTHGVPHDREADRREVNADLMRSAGCWHHIEQCVPAPREATIDPPGGVRFAHCDSADTHPLAILWVSADRQIHAARVCARDAAHHSPIDPLDHVIMELPGEVAVSIVGLGGHQ
jgi:hypothetical protein